MARTSSKIVKSIPSSENGKLVTCTTVSKEQYLITHCLDKGRFTLWKVLSEDYEKISTDSTPIDLYDKIPWFD